MTSQVLCPVDESDGSSRALHSESPQKDVQVLNTLTEYGLPEESTGNVGTTTFISPEELKPDIRPIIRLKPRRVQTSFRALQQWEVVVDEITDDSVWVRMLDLTNKEYLEETAELLLEEIPLDDRELLSQGSVLYWSIGIETAAGGQIQKVSRIRAKRSGMWTSRRISKIHQQGTSFFESIVNGNSDTSTGG